MDVHPPKNGINSIDPYPYERIVMPWGTKKWKMWSWLPRESLTKREMPETRKPLDLHQLHWYQTSKIQDTMGVGNQSPKECTDVKKQWFPHHLHRPSAPGPHSNGAKIPGDGRLDSLGRTSQNGRGFRWTPGYTVKSSLMTPGSSYFQPSIPRFFWFLLDHVNLWRSPPPSSCGFLRARRAWPHRSRAGNSASRGDVIWGSTVGILLDGSISKTTPLVSWFDLVIQKTEDHRTSYNYPTVQRDTAAPDLFPSTPPWPCSSPDRQRLRRSKHRPPETTEVHQKWALWSNEHDGNCKFTLW